MTTGAKPVAFTLEEIRRHVGGTIEHGAEVRLTGVAAIDEAGEGDVTFVANPKYRAALASTRASAVLVDQELEGPPGLPLIRTADPYFALLKVVELFAPGPPEVGSGVHATAVVHADANLGDGVRIGPLVVIEAGARLGRGTCVAARSYVGADATVGEDCYLYPGVFLGRGCVLGDRVTIHPGAVLGADGFGYAPVEGRWHKIPQIGIVEVHDDVEIGANSCIDRAALGKTVIGRGTKIDNLVQIAHNVAIGQDCVLIAQSGISGSTRIGDRVRVGGQAGLIGHLKIGDGAAMAAQAGVIGDVPAGVTVSGYPARPHREALRAEASLRRLPELQRRVRALEARQGEAGADSSAKERGSS